MNSFDEAAHNDTMTEAAVVADLALAVAEPSNFDPSVPQGVIVPKGGALLLPDLSAWRDRPVRKTGTYRPATVVALASFLDSQEVDGDTTVWVHPTSGLVTAVIDDNGEQPGYGQHRAVLQLRTTEEWDYWIGNDQQWLGQEDFAEHIEGGLDEIEQPDAADVLEMAQSFHATSKASFRSQTRLQSGEVQFLYDEEITASAGAKGELTIPTKIVLLVAPFVGEEPVQLLARFRYRIGEGRLKLSYQLERPEKLKREAIERIADRLAARFARTYVGEAPGA